MKKIVFAVVFCFISSASVFAQSQQPPCSQERAKQFDFWVGTWNLEWVDAQGKTQKGTNVIKKIMNGCVVEENFDGGGAPTYLGTSHSMFDQISGKWKQTWVDNGGNYLDFTGEFKEGRMILNRQFINPAGKKVMQKMTFYNIQKDSIEWLWERSDDEGKTWQTNWKLNYSRNKAAVKPFNIKDVKMTIDEANKVYGERLLRNDAAYFVEKYTANACTMPPNMQRICGRDNIRKYFYGDGKNTEVKLFVTAEDVSGSEQLVVETGSYSVNDLKGNVLEKGKFIATWKLEDGKWKMHSEIWSSDDALPKS